MHVYNLPLLFATVLACYTFSNAHVLPEVGLTGMSGIDMTRRQTSDTTGASAPAIIQHLATQVQPHVDEICAVADVHNDSSTVFSQQVNAISQNFKQATVQMSLLKGQPLTIITGTDNASNGNDNPVDLLEYTLALLFDALTPLESWLASTSFDHNGLLVDVHEFANAIDALKVPGLLSSLLNHLKEPKVAALATQLGLLESASI
ncbi:hypothetical protein EW145_g6295 [Phellinidium pouzarii]|uniref:Uncharacterized protein n=1 Tax=Phellinidium pouzarii TaxID=167371 RepID=A0A4S4KXL1_9AGAM|nr:hypothetical protein EW145_g6295 [Phellinidium pouzarii]